MLSKALDVPFPRNRLPIFKESIIHGHYLSSWNMKNVVIVWRDGRDVMVSQYFHSLFTSESRKASYFVEKARKHLPFNDYNNVSENLPRFIEYSFREKRSPRFSWADFVDCWHGYEEAEHVKYEQLLSETANELLRIVRKLKKINLSRDRAKSITDEFSFEKLSGRKVGEEKRDSFLRKGIVGDWKNYYSKEACEVFAQYAGTQLIKLGYESDSSWVDSSP
jgi:hypothetical protein